MNSEHNDQSYHNDNDDEGPEYLDSNDVIEVATLDDTTDQAPMDEDDDDDDDGITDIVDGMNGNGNDDDDDEDDDDAIVEPSRELVMTLSSSHTGPVYTCALLAIPTTTSMTTANNNNNNIESSLLLATGGGDDIACLTRCTITPTMDVVEASLSTTMIPADSNNVPHQNQETRATATATATAVDTQQLAYHHSDSVSAVAFGILPAVSSPTTAATTTTPETTPNILLAVGGYDGMIVLYDGTNGNCLMNISNMEEFKSNFAGPTDIEWLTFHKTGTVLLAGSSTDGTVWMYHVVVPSPKQPNYYTLNCMQVFVGHASMVSAGGFTSDGRWAVSIGNSGTRDDATIRIWNPKSGIAKHTIHLHSGSTTGILASANTFDDDDSPYAGLTCLAFGIADEPGTTQAATSTVATPMNSTSSKLLLVGSEDGWAYVCHVTTGKVLHAFRHAIEPSAYNNNNISGAMDIDSHNDTEMETELLLSIEAAGFCPSNPMWCATGGADGVLKIWDLHNGQCRHSCRVTNPASDPSAHVTKNRPVIGGITRLHWLPSNALTTGTTSCPPIVFVATTDGMVHIWDARNGDLLRSLQTGSRATINDLQLLPIINNRVIIVTASEDNAVRLFQLNLIELLQ